MVVFNADGSVAEMCGNGLRCAILYLTTRRSAPHSFVVETGAGPLRCRDEGDGMFSAELGGVNIGETCILEVGGLPGLSGRAADTGNPHLVVLNPPFRLDEAPLEALGRAAQHLPSFPDGVNLELAWTTPSGGLAVRVWERGVGETQACGTGACAAAAVAVSEGLLPPGNVEVGLPGGKLLIGAANARRGVRMTGPAVSVFQGAMSPEAIETSCSAGEVCRLLRVSWFVGCARRPAMVARLWGEPSEATRCSRASGPQYPPLS